MLLLWLFSTTFSYVVRGIPADLSLLPDPLTQPPQKTVHGSRSALARRTVLMRTFSIGDSQSLLRKNGGNSFISRREGSRGRGSVPPPSFGAFGTGHSATRAAQDVNVFFTVGSVEHAGDQVSLGGHRPVTDGAGSGKLRFLIWMAMGTAEDMTHTVFFSGKHRALELIVPGEGCAAEGADAFFSRNAFSAIARFMLPRRGREYPIGKDKKRDADKNQKNRIEGTWNHASIMHQNWPCRNR